MRSHYRNDERDRLCASMALFAAVLIVARPIDEQSAADVQGCQARIVEHMADAMRPKLELLQALEVASDVQRLHLNSSAAQHQCGDIVRWANAALTNMRADAATTLSDF